MYKKILSIFLVVLIVLGSVQQVLARDLDLELDREEYNNLQVLIEKELQKSLIPINFENSYYRAATLIQYMFSLDHFYDVSTGIERIRYSNVIGSIQNKDYEMLQNTGYGYSDRLMKPVNASANVLSMHKLLDNKQLKGKKESYNMFEERLFLNKHMSDVQKSFNKLDDAIWTSPFLEYIGESNLMKTLTDMLTSGQFTIDSLLEEFNKVFNNVKPPSNPKVEISDWAKDSLSRLEEKNVKIPSKDYKKNITRQEFAKLYTSAYIKKYNIEVDYGNLKPFNDTKDVDVLISRNLNLINGVGDNNFNPTGVITRQDIMVMLDRGLNTGDLSDINFKDQKDISPYALNPIKRVINKNIVKGVGDNRLNPLGNTSVEEAIVMVDRYLETE